LEFVEYEETRNYGRHVFSSKAVYEYLELEKAP
jgi:hypothetical protein